jgi:hypothetical protein
MEQEEDGNGIRKQHQWRVEGAAGEGSPVMSLLDSSAFLGVLCVSVAGSDVVAVARSCGVRVAFV